jgi:hypothetical protein
MGSARKDIDPKRLEEWLRAISTTEPEEIDCDALSEVIEEAVEAAAAGADVRSLLPSVAVHLDHCPDCRDWYDTLVDWVQENE